MERPKPSETVLFSYDTGALELFETAKKLGVRCVLGQMDPHAIEFRLIREEETRWPGWARVPSSLNPAYDQRRRREWQLADAIVVNSNFSRRALVEQRVPESKIITVPLCFETQVPEVERADQKGKLKVLFLGQVILRKGVQYLIQVAHQLKDEDIEFLVVGNLGINADKLNALPANLRILSNVTRAEVSRYYQWANVFVLPTISDGFALTQIESMAHGVPVVATPNCGEVVQDGVNGKIVPIRDVRALASAILEFHRDREGLAKFSLRAKERSREFSLKRLAKGLGEIEHILGD